MQVVVIGGGPAGIRATRGIKKLKPDCEVIVIRPEYKSLIYCALPYVIEEIIEFPKVYKKDELITEVGAKLIRKFATKVDFDNKEVHIEDGESIRYDKLLIVTGADPIIPSFVPSGLGNVFVFKKEEDLRGILKQISEGAKKAIVVGAGSIGVELTQALRKQKLETHLIEMADYILPNLIDKEFADSLNELFTKDGIELHLSSPVKKVEGDGFASKIILGNGEEISLSDKDILVFTVGVKPNVETFKGSNLKIERDGIVVDRQMRTNIEDVYAAGDCCSFVSGIDGKPIQGKLATNAVPMGKVAAANIVGKRMEYDGFYNGAATKVYNVRVAGTGFSETLAKQRGFNNIVTGYGQTTAKFSILPDPGFVKVKLIVNKDDGQVIGGQILTTMCATERIDLITFAIQNKLTIDKLAKLSYSAQPFQSFFPANNAIVMSAEDAMSKM